MMWGLVIGGLVLFAAAWFWGFTTGYDAKFSPSIRASSFHADEYAKGWYFGSVELKGYHKRKLEFMQYGDSAYGLRWHDQETGEVLSKEVANLIEGRILATKMQRAVLDGLSGTTTQTEEVRSTTGSTRMVNTIPAVRLGSLEPPTLDDVEAINEIARRRARR